MRLNYFIGFLTLLLSPMAHAAEPVWQRLVDDETLLVVTAPVDAEAWEGWIQEVGGHFPLASMQVVSQIQEFQQAGVSDLSIVLGVPDMQSEAGPVLVLSLQKSKDATAIALKSEQLIALVEASQMASRMVKAKVFAFAGDEQCILLGREKTLQRYAEKLGDKIDQRRTDFVDAVSQSGGAKPTAVAVLSPGPDARRVIRELWPELPPPWKSLTGPLLADGVHHLALTLPLGEVPSIGAELSCNDEASAEALKDIADQGISAAIDALVQSNPEMAGLAFALSRALHPEREAKRVSLTLRRDDPMIDRLVREVLPTTAASLQESAFARQRMNVMKQLALGMLNYESSYGHLPTAAAIRDKQGKPLLSWRVAILPWLEQQELYNRFHLDEPWDSPHNRKLLKEMPRVYSDPTVLGGTEEKTRYQVPLGTGTLFPGVVQPQLRERKGIFFGEGTRYRDIVDGASNTIMIAEVASEHAVPWTKPADWEVDLGDPLAAIRQQGRKTFATCWADGHASMVDNQIDPKEFRKALTIGGREILDTKKW